MANNRADLEFLQDLFKKFVLAKISSHAGKNSKKPRFDGWLNITEEQSRDLASYAKYQSGPFIFMTGGSTQFMAVDVDRKDSSREDHADKIDGVSYWHKHADYKDS